jgi:hypothetical protein
MMSLTTKNLSSSTVPYHNGIVLVPGSENFERSTKILTAQVGLAGFWGIFMSA